MNDIVVTYGPEPKVWCTSCHNDTPLMAHIDGTLRPGDVEQAQHKHVCGTPAKRWDVDQEGRAS